MEDDCIFTKQILNISNIIDKVPTDWNMLYLGHVKHINNNNSKEIKNSHFRKLIKGIATTHIYAITQDCAKILMDNTYPLRAAIDGFIAHFIINNKLLDNVYVCKSTICQNGSLNGNFKSTLR